MTTEYFITDLFCQVDDQMEDVPKHPQAHLFPSEVVTLALLFALKGVGNRPFYRWIEHDWRPLFPNLRLHAHVCSDCSRPIRTGQTAF